VEKPTTSQTGLRSNWMAADLDPATVLLAGMGMVAAPIAMPQVARELFGVDPSSAEFRERYAEQLHRIATYLSGGPHGQAQESDPSGPARSGHGQPSNTGPSNTGPTS
jgi:hypothetical protein